MSEEKQTVMVSPAEYLKAVQANVVEAVTMVAANEKRARDEERAADEKDFAERQAKAKKETAERWAFNCAIEERKVAAYESIARSLERIANRHGEDAT